MTDPTATTRPRSALARLVERIETASALDDASSAARSVVAPLAERDALRDALTGKWIGHALHPAVVLLPLSCWISTATLDVAGGQRSRHATQRLIGLGILGTAPAALTGILDWSDTEEAEQRVGSVHAAMNATATVLFAASWWQRRRGRHARGVVTSLAATTIAGMSAYLGGHLTYRRGVGVDTTAFQSGPEDWSDIELDADAPEATRSSVRHAMSGALDLAVIGRGDDVAVMESRCTHRGGPLHEGTVSDGCITCPWHGSRFDVETGEVLTGPATAPQPTYECRSSEDRVSIRRTEHGSLRRNPVGAAHP